MVLLLRGEEVAQLLTLEEAIGLMEHVAIEQDADSAFNVSGWSEAAPLSVRVVASTLGGLDRLGIRINSPGDIQLLFENQSREPLAIMGYPVSGVRIGASVAVAVKHLARADVRTAAVVGSGTVALASLRGVCAVRPIERAWVFSPSPAHREQFCLQASQELDLPVEACESIESAVDQADLIISATSSQRPVIHIGQLHPGCLMVGAGMTQEMDASIYMGADQIVVSGRAQEGRDTKSARAGGSAIRDLLADGRLSADRLVNLAQVVRGEVVPRNGPAEVLVYRESRGPAGDVALASWIVDRAREAKLGTEFRF